MSAFKLFIKRIINILNELNVNYVVVGGVAVIISGRSRTTTDLDLIIENNERKFWDFINKLKEDDFDVSLNQAKYALKEGFNLSIFDNRSIMRIDLKLAKKKDDLDALENVRMVNYEDIKIKIPTLEQILYSKLKYIGEVSELADEEILEYNDILDFIVLFRNNIQTIDLELLDHKIRRTKYIKTFERLKKLIEGKASSS